MRFLKCLDCLIIGLKLVKLFFVLLHTAIEATFELTGKSVETEEGTRLGKVRDYAVDSKSLFISKLYVNQNIFRSLSNFTRPQFIVDRSQIIDVTDTKVIVREAAQKATDAKTAAAQA